MQPVEGKPLTKQEKKKLKQLAKKQEKEEAGPIDEITASQGRPQSQQDQVTTEVRLEVKILTVQQKQVIEGGQASDAL